MGWTLPYSSQMIGLFHNGILGKSEKCSPLLWDKPFFVLPKSSWIAWICRLTDVNDIQLTHLFICAVLPGNIILLGKLFSLCKYLANYSSTIGRVKQLKLKFMSKNCQNQGVYRIQLFLKVLGGFLLIGQSNRYSDHLRILSLLDFPWTK